MLRAIRWQGRETLLRDYYRLEIRLDSLLIGGLLALLLSWDLMPAPAAGRHHSPSRGMEAVLTVPALVWLGRIFVRRLSLAQPDPDRRARGRRACAARLHVNGSAAQRLRQAATE